MIAHLALLAVLLLVLRDAMVAKGPWDSGRLACHHGPHTLSVMTEPEPWTATGLREQAGAGAAARVALIGRVAFAAGERGLEHRHVGWELLLPLAGRMDLLGEDGDRQVPQGAAVVVPPDLGHTVRAGARRPLDLVYAVIELEPAPGATECWTLLPAQRPALQVLRALVQEAVAGECTWAALADDPRLLLQLLAVLGERIEAPGESASPRRRLVDQVCRELAAHIDRDIQVTELAAAFYLHPDTLAEMFRRERGTTIKAYHRALRLDQAWRRLRAGDTAVTAVARELGFGTVQRFSREFRRAFGLPPSRVRGRSRPDP